MTEDLEIDHDRDITSELGHVEIGQDRDDDLPILHFVVRVTCRDIRQIFRNFFLIISKKLILYFNDKI